MVHGIPAQGSPDWSRGAHTPRVSARAVSVDTEVSRTGALQVKTDDGDTITISFAALEQLHAESFRGKSRVQQHQLVYNALKGQIGGALHALALQTGLPEG